MEGDLSKNTADRRRRPNSPANSMQSDAENVTKHNGPNMTNTDKTDGSVRPQNHSGKPPQSKSGDIDDDQVKSLDLEGIELKTRIHLNEKFVPHLLQVWQSDEDSDPGEDDGRVSKVVDTDDKSGDDGRLNRSRDSYSESDYEVLDGSDLFDDMPTHVHMLREWGLLDDDDDGMEPTEVEHPPARPHYPQGPLITHECFVCFEETTLRRRLCCDFPVCDSCLEAYLTVQVSQATVHIECLNSNCQSYIHRDEIMYRLPSHMKSKFYKFLIDANLDPTLKTCPRCSHAVQVDRAMLKKRKVVKNGLYVTCPKCLLEWCFSCHSPWHKGITCRAFRKGDLLLKDWAREFHYGQLNAQKCPKCKIYIQRSLGCDHMTCSRCETSFCYRCGEHYRSVKLLGNHFSRLSPFGCRYNFMPDAPHTRRLIRGAVLGGKLLLGLGLSGFAMAAGAFLLGVSVVVLPIWGGYKLHKRRRFRKQVKRNIYSNYGHGLASRPPDPLVLMTVRMPERSDSTVDWDDSSDENHDHMRQLVLGLRLPDSQRVEVLVHRPVGSNSDQEEQGATGGGEGGEPIILTDVQEVTNEDGYTTFVTHIYAKQGEGKDAEVLSDISDDSTDTEGEDWDGGGEPESKSTMKGAGRTRGRNRQQNRQASNSTGAVKREGANGGNSEENEERSAQKHENKPEDKADNKPGQISCFSLVLNKDGAWKAMDGEKSDNGFLHRLRERRQRDKEKDKEREKEIEKEKEKTKGKEKERERESEKDKVKEKVKEKEGEKEEREQEKVKEKEPSSEEDKTVCDSPDQLAKDGTNGCFGNIFAKKLTALQISNSNHTTSDVVSGRPKMPWRKAATWEKGSEKGSQHKHISSVDFCDSAPRKDKDLFPVYPAQFNVSKGGLLLQDCLVLSGEELLADNDDISVLSSSSVDIAAPAKGGSACSLSASEGFRGSTLSCDIVTYL